MKAKEKNAPIEYARENARYWDMEIVPYSKLQEIRPMMDNTIQSMHEMIEAMDEQSEEEAKPDAASITHVRPVRQSTYARPDTRQKKKMLSKSTMRCFLSDFSQS